MKRVVLNKKDLIYPELSYTIVGILFETYNALGYGYKEIYYQRAIANNLRNCRLLFKEQVPAEIKFKGGIIGKIYLDFLIENSIILEIKKSDRFAKQEINQVHGYLKATGRKLGILAHFTKDGIKFKRILNIS
jgi:GxxExxY protein